MSNSSNLAFEWMGFSPPVSHGKYKNDSFKQFKCCMKESSGIGDFSYWDKTEIAKLSDDEKLKLLKLLMAHCTMTEDRIYLGLTKDGKINNQIDEYADGRTHFYSTLDVESCRKRKYFHNERTRYTDGFYCDGCKTFFSKETEDWIKGERLGFGAWNLRASFYRLKLDIPDEVKKLYDEQEEIEKQTFYERDVNKILDLYRKIVVLWEKYKYVREESEKV